MKKINLTAIIISLIVIVAIIGIMLIIPKMFLTFLMWLSNDGI